jgi:hypothetical protein
VSVCKVAICWKVNCWRNICSVRKGRWPYWYIFTNFQSWWDLNFKITPCPAILRVLKKFQIGGISCHNNTKFLHAIADVCLNLMHKKNWTAMCIWSLTHQWEILRSKPRHSHSLHIHYNINIAQISGFCGIACESQFSHLLPEIQFCVTHFKTLPYTKPNVAFSGVRWSAYLHRFSDLRLLLSSHTGHEQWDFPSSPACVTEILSADLSVWPSAEFP